MLIVFSAVDAEETTGRDIMEKVDNRYTGDDQIAEMTMTLIKSSGRKRVRKVKVWQKDYGKNDKSLMRFLEPADVRGTGFLVWEHESKDDDQWLYLPALKKVRRISSKEKEKSFMGTDFSYDDLGSHDLDDYDYAFLRSETFNDQDCYVIKSVPKPEKKKSYSKTISWIRKDIFIATKIEFYDKKGEFLKRMHAFNIEKINEIWTTKKMEMENVQKKHITILELENVRYNIGLKDNIFTERNLIKE
jgi:outer membrane lipoprotein-sorting protein